MSADRPPAHHSILNVRARPARNSLALSLGTLAATLLSAGQAFIIPFFVHDPGQTDAFFFAYAFYLPIALWAAASKASMIPLFATSRSDEEFRKRASAILFRMTLIAVLPALALILVSPIVFHTLAHHLAHRDTALMTLLLLAPTAYCQIYAATLAATLNATRRFVASALFYVIGSTISLGSTVLLLSIVGVIGVAIGLLVGSLVTAVMHTLYVRSFGVGPRRCPAAGINTMPLVSRLAAGNALIVAPHINLLIALASLRGESGSVTAYSYAFLLVWMLLSLSAAPLAIGSLPDIVLRTQTRGSHAAGEQIVSVAPLTYVLLIPAISALVFFGEPLLRALFVDSLRPETVALMHDLIVVFAIMALPAAFFILLIGATLGLRRWRVSVVVAAASVAIQAVAIGAIGSRNAVDTATAHATSMALATIILAAAVFGKTAVPIIGSTLHQAAPAFALAGIFPVLRLLVGPHPSAWAAFEGILAGTALYTALLALLWRTVARRLREMLPRHRQTT